MEAATSQQQDNPFASAEAWETSTDQLLPIGGHVVLIESAEDGTAGTQNPQIELKFSNDQGSIRAWETYSETFLRKVVALYDCAGLERPKVGEFDPNDHCRLTEAKIAELRGKKIGIVVHDEKDDRDPTGEKTRRRVKGYVLPAEIQDDIPADTRGLPSAEAPSSSRPEGEKQSKIPFLWDGPYLEAENVWHGHTNR